MQGESPEPIHEAHYLTFNVGHIVRSGHDCWCEPRVTWKRNAHGVLIMFVEHNDNTMRHHVKVLETRDAVQSWTTKILDSASPSEGPEIAEDEEIIFETEIDLEDFLDDESSENEE